MKWPTIASILLLLQACSHTPEIALPRAKNVDLSRFMGDWYVIANIPTFIEKGAHNAIESYAMNKDGTVDTTFSFYQDSFKGELKKYNPTGYVSENNNSEWDMQFIWPFKAEYIISYLSKDYKHTIIARSDRDYLWVMSRSPVIDEELYQSLIQRSVDMGYQRELIIKVPQQIRSSHNQDAVKMETIQ